MDIVTVARRSQMMSGIRGANTQPELTVRKYLHSVGYRFRLHQKTLPGTPDIVLKKYRAAVFVHGCFWHRHPGCKFATTPATRREFWIEKLEKNRARDLRAQLQLMQAGWRVAIVWECALKKDRHSALTSLRGFIESDLLFEEYSSF